MRFIVDPRENSFVNYCFCPTLFNFFGSLNSCQQVSIGTCANVCNNDCLAVGVRPQNPPQNPGADNQEQDMFGPGGLFGNGN